MSTEKELILAKREGFVEGARRYQHLNKGPEGRFFDATWGREAEQKYPLIVTEPRVKWSQREPNIELRVVNNVVEQRWTVNGRTSDWVRAGAVYVEDIDAINDLRANPTITKATD